MCVSVPATIVSISGDLLPMAVVDLAGQEQTVSLMYLPDAAVGDHVLIQGGHAVVLLDAESAQESLDAWAELGLDGPGSPR